MLPRLPVRFTPLAQPLERKIGKYYLALVLKFARFNEDKGSCCYRYDKVNINHHRPC